MALTQLLPALAAWTLGNHVNLYVGDVDTYQAALRMVESASASVQFETFVFNGEQGEGLTEAFLQARRRGVNVQVVFDNKAIRFREQRQLARKLLAGGVDVHAYDLRYLHNSITGIDHAKILLVDARQALVGGTNFDAHVNYDLNFQVEGPVVPIIADKFAESWHNSYSAGCVSAVAGRVAPVPAASGVTAKPGDTAMLVTETPLAKGPHVGLKTKTLALQAIAEASRSIDLLQYVLDDPQEIEALKVAAARGVKVRALLNPPGRKGSFSVLSLSGVRKLQDAGIPVRYFVQTDDAYELHAKVAIFDGTKLLGGTTNWMTGANENFNEVGVWLEGPVVSQVTDLYEAVWRERTRAVPTLSGWERFKSYLLGGVARFL